MADDLLIIQHHVAEGPGRLLEWTQQHGLSTKICMAHEIGPSMGEAFAGLVLLGGPQSIVDQDSQLRTVQQLAQHFLSTDKPVLGICLGAQLLASVLGCEVMRMDHAEQGWLPVKVQDRVLWVPQWHEDAIIANENTQVFIQSTQCSTQGFVHGDHALGLQFHPEWTNHSIQQLHHHFSDCPVALAPNHQWQQHLQQFLFGCLNLWWHKQLTQLINPLENQS